MTNEILLPQLEALGFELKDGEPGVVSYYSTEYINLYLYENPFEMNIYFGYSESGVFSIKKATIEQVRSVAALFVAANFETTDEFALNSKDTFRLSLLDLLRDFIKRDKTKPGD